MIVDYKIFEKMINNITLYHGSFRNFNEFRSGNAFFSEVEKFAIEYAERKASEHEFDDDLFLHTCIFHNINVFDINDEKDYNLLYNKLPNEIYINGKFFGFGGELEKDLVFKYLKGVVDVDESNYYNNNNIGDVFTTDNNSHTYYVLDKNDKEIICMDEFRYKTILEKHLNNLKSEYSYLKYIKEFQTKLVDVINKSDLDSMLKFTAKAEGKLMYISKTYLKDKFTKLYNEYYDKIVEELRLELLDKYKYLKKYKIYIYQTDVDNWNFYESDMVYDTILSLGYDGIKMVEGNDSTFVLFNPNKHLISKTIKKNKMIVEYNLFLEKLNTKDIELNTKDIESNSNFKKWFGNSKVVDENGNPLMVYHGSKYDFNEFDVDKIKSNRRAGFHFIKNIQLAQNYQKDGKLYKVYLSLQNPLNSDETKKIDISKEDLEKLFKEIGIDDDVEKFYNRADSDIDILEDLIRNSNIKTVLKAIAKILGKDGIITSDHGLGKSYIVFKPNQIKSINNDGSFDIDDDNIYS